ncbi:MAG: sulfotransferase family 2 domain-containing protein [Halofilum sp. (in: g-proteobacteria)]|nr:sulfotransferase family 2 domain-containing protein [Halofilum sp. (in: g-proteobacteria)]
MAIVCHSRRLIFVKTRKTAGSSVEIALSRLCDDGDLVTPLGDENGPEEQLRREAGGHPPVNWKKPWWRYKFGKELRHRIKYGKKALLLGTHATAEQLRAHFGEDVWSSYYKVTLERNPWDKALSRYWWQRYRRLQRGDTTEFPPIGEFLERIARERPYWLSNWGHYTIEDEIAVDRVLFYERLTDDLTALEQELGLDAGTLALPEKRAKGGHRADRRHYSEVLSDADRELIARVCHREIEAFGYEFDDWRRATTTTESANA